jgi:hypothetical protein
MLKLGDKMKEILITNRHEIDTINKEINWIESQIQDFTTYLNFQNHYQDKELKDNIRIYTDNILGSCYIIKNYLEITE